MKCRVAVCIVSYKNPHDVVRCLEALGDSRWSDFEVVICENGGPVAFDNLRKAVPAALPGGQPVRPLLADSNLGYAGGVNLCIANSRDADAWWILNPDTIPSQRALGAMVARLQRGDCEAVGNTVYLEDGRVQSFGGFWRRSMARAVSIGHGSRPAAEPGQEAIESKQNYLNGASMLVSRRFIEIAGLMEEDYFLYCEEVEWCLRAQELGLLLGFAPDAPVTHLQGTSTGNSTDLRQRSKISVYLGERNRLLLTRDRYPHLLLLAAVAAFGLLLLRFGRGKAWRQLGYAARGWGAGLMNRRGVPHWHSEPPVLARTAG